MQYKMSICNNETLIKGLKAKLKEQEEKKVKTTRSKGKENQPKNNQIRHVKLDLMPKQDLTPIIQELQNEKVNM